MKLIYTILALAVVQSVCAANFKKAASNEETEFIQFYRDNLELLAESYSEQAKQLSQKILKIKKVNQATTPIIKEFRQNVTNFLQEYSFYKNYNLYSEIVKSFADTFMEYYYQSPKDPESEYIVKLLEKLDYEKIDEEYEEIFEKFMKKKFLPKLDDFIANTNKEDLKLALRVMQRALTNCQDYECYDDYLPLFTFIFYSPKEELLDSIFDTVDRINSLYVIDAYNISKSLLKDNKLQLISQPVRKNLTKDLGNFIKLYENTKDFEDIDDISLFFHNNITLKYYDNTKIPQKDQQLIKDIFNRNDFDTFRRRNKVLLREFVRYDIPKIFKKFKDTSTEEELFKERKLWQWYENVKDLKNHNKRVEAFRKLYSMEKV